MEELLVRSKVDRGTAESKSGVLVFACKVRPSINKMTVIDLLDMRIDPNDRTVKGRSAMMLAARRRLGDCRGIDRPWC